MVTLELDGSIGEGGGQILRTALALSLVTGTPFHIEKIRAGRSIRGLLRQHLTAVNAAAEVGRAQVVGAELGSQQLQFAPGKVAPGSYRFDVGTAGSATLVLQTVLPPLLIASGRSDLTLEGGTHNPHAPPFDFLARVFLPLVARMGPRLGATLERPGFFPAGGGRFTLSVAPAPLSRLDLPDRGAVVARRARAVVANLPAGIAERELTVLAEQLRWSRDTLHAEEATASTGPGNVVMVEVESEHVSELFTAFGAKGLRAEVVAERAAQEALRYLAAEVPVGEHLADQLLVPMALAGGGSFRTLSPTRHTTTNAAVIRKFMNVKVDTSQVAEDVWQIAVRKH
jgi:RNA 3'-terminal phosphate cyclase (ATP)